MAKPRHLRNAPITEALVHLQVRPGDANFSEVSKNLVTSLAPSFYAKGEIRENTVKVAVNSDDGVLPTVSSASHALGIRLHSQDEKYVAQVTQQNLTVSRLEPYEDWETFRGEVRRVWEIYRGTTRPEVITRVAIRYINTILVPVTSETRLEKIFVRPPMEPEGMSELISSFLNRCVVEDPLSRASIVVTLASQRPSVPNIYPVILDIEAVRQAEFPVDDSTVWSCLETLRDLKNAAFFGSLTEEQVRRYE